ncbi:ferric-chelate reductase 1-like [Liolophura sinensis]|uniref:ferric-chelate reductase 1-like n=1 Tax=Liolophura sinensis TaxID=3198878 RepID=UPI0031593DAC
MPTELGVTLDTSCGIPFKGFMLQARQANSLNTQSIVGSFSEPGLAGTHLLDCSGGKVVTHTNNNEKNNLEFEWTVTGSLTEHVVFVATFVRGFSEFYVKVYSEVLKYTGDNNLPTGTFPTPHECPVLVVSLRMLMWNFEELLL